MGKAHEVAVGADARAFDEGIRRGVIKPVEDAVRALDDLEDATADAGRGGERSLDKLEDKLKDVGRQSDKVAREVGRDFDKGFDKAGDSARKFGSDAKDELRDAGREGAASFSGELSDVGDVFQETAANLGPGGIAGAAVLGAVIATATAAVEEWNDKIDGIKASTAEMWQAAADAGQDFLAQDAIQAEASRINWDKAYDEQRRAAEKAGVSRVDLAIALASGEGEIYDRVHQQIMTAREEERQAAMDSLAASTDGNVALQDATAAVNSELARTVSVLDEKARATDENKRKAEEAAEIEKTLQETTRDQINRTADAAQSRYEGLAAQYADPIKARVEISVDDRAAQDAFRRLEQRAAKGLNVAVTGTLAGRTWE